MNKLLGVLAVLVGSFLSASLPALANDSAISGTSGTPGNLKATQLAGEHKTIRMVREQVVMIIGKNDYVTDARFVFHNSGPAITVQMGFPEGAGGDSNFDQLKKKTAFKEFATWVDGRRIRARRMVADANEDDFTLDAFWVKSVRFGRNQTRRVRVRYRSELGTSTDGDFVFYDFTGGNWKGKVNESTLKINFTVPGYYRFFPLDKELGKYTRVDGNNAVALRWRNWQAQAGFALRYMRTLPNGLTRAYDAKDMNDAWDPYDNMRTLVVRGNKNSDIWKADANWPPTALVRDGHTFVQFRHLSDAMREKWENTKNGGKPSKVAGMHAHKGWFAAPLYKGGGMMSFTLGSKQAQIGGKTVALPAAPFVAGGVCYVPLVATINALKGQVKVSTQAKRFWFDVPV